MPKLSVIIPVYNVEQYLEEAILSVINQTFQDWECILINDGSTDNSGKICEEWSAKDKRFRVINQENHGLSAARNAGLNIATGQYIAFLDSDDIFVNKDLFKLNIEVLEQNLAVDFIQFPTIYINTDNKPNSTQTQTTILTGKNEVLIGFQNKIISQTCWNKIYRANSIPNQIRFPTGLYYEDEWFITELLTHVSNVIIGEYGRYGYRIREGSIIHGVINQRKKNDWIIKRIHTSYIASQYKCLVPLYIDEYSQLIQELSYNYYYNDLQSIDQFIEKVISITPSLGFIFRYLNKFHKPTLLKIIFLKLFRKNGIYAYLNILKYIHNKLQFKH